MSAPSLPANTATLQPGVYDTNGRSTRMWINRDGPARQKIFVDVETGIPLSVTDEYFEEADSDGGGGGGGGGGGTGAAGAGKAKGRWVSVMTYSWEHIAVGQPDEAAFEIAQPWGAHDACARHVGGWPYIHAFHTYLKV
jgi:hypothetical protein